MGYIYITPILTDSWCTPGYILVPGDIPGWGQIRGNIKKNAADCAKLCNEERDCCSYEHSPSENTCNLNSDCKPSQEKYKDYNFCVQEGVKGRNSIIFLT